MIYYVFIHIINIIIYMYIKSRDLLCELLEELWENEAHESRRVLILCTQLTRRRESSLSLVSSGNSDDVLLYGTMLIIPLYM